MVSLSDFQLRIVMDTAAGIQPDRRDIFLQRIAAMLALRGRGHFNDDDVIDVVGLATCGLIHRVDAA